MADAVSVLEAENVLSDLSATDIIRQKRKINTEKVDRVHMKAGYKFFKRTLDIVCSGAGLILTCPVMLCTAIVVKANTEGPAIYVQERLGLNGKPFKLYKFRSMYIDAECEGAKWAEENDERITPVGKFLRKTRLDELPQLLNIFVGQMSLVGPRPERKVFYEEFSSYIDGFDQRLMVKPGLTGLAQVNGGYDLKPEEKIVYDIKYIKNMSVKEDVKCIAKTVRIVFSHEGAR